MTHDFSRVPSANIPRSVFDRSHGFKTTLDSGYLVPVYVDEALPGDTFKLRMTSFGRLATPIVPFMDNLFLDTFFFAVPIRLIWDNWQKFNGEQDNPGDSTDYMVPVVNSPAEGYAVQSLADYFGIPTGVEIQHNVLWHRAYNLIWNEWFRDQNLQDSVPVNRGDGPDIITDYTLLKRGKRHDYFTSCLPWTQKGPAVDLPFAFGTASVHGNGKALGLTDGVNLAGAADAASGGAGFIATYQGNYDTSLGTPISGPPYLNSGSINVVPKGKASNLEVDLSTATNATINQLRQAFQIQKLYERDARGGTRYTEIIRSHFGVVSPDARLQRPEYLGGSSTPIHVHPVEQTSGTLEPTIGDTPQGNVSAFATVSDTRAGFTKSFTEHCILIGMINIRADLNYQHGLHRMFSRRTRWDFYWPALSHIGEQAVLNKEIYAQGGTSDEEVFGYQERYAEYRYKPSLITGQFRSTAANTLDFWHLAQHFTSLPTLSSTFIEETPPLDRVLAVTQNTPQMVFDSYFRIKCARPMPVYSVPGLIDHF